MKLIYHYRSFKVDFRKVFYKKNLFLFYIFCESTQYIKGLTYKAEKAIYVRWLDKGAKVIQMQLIYPSHQTQIGLTDRFCPIIDAATADAQDPSLFGDR